LYKWVENALDRLTTDNLYVVHSNAIANEIAKGWVIYYYLLHLGMDTLVSIF